jgi:hypothetical protein
VPPIKSIAVPVKKKASSHSRKRKTAVARPEGRLADALPVEIRRAPPPTVAQPSHRFRVGERLRMTNGGRTLSRAAASCVVVARMPYEGRGHLLYRVRSDTEHYERVVAEMDLSRPEAGEP